MYVAPDIAVPPGPLQQYCAVHIEPLPNELTETALYFDESGLALLDGTHALPFRLNGASLPTRGRGAPLLLRACGALGASPSVFDAFLGFGLDALQLAMAGCQVTGVEQNVVAWLMAWELAQRLEIEVDFQLGDGPQILNAGGDGRWDVVYLDPMFPARNKKALPGRAMQQLRALADGPATCLADVIECARGHARQRVVLKRRLRDPNCGVPTFQLKGRTVRFDVYEV